LRHWLAIHDKSLGEIDQMRRCVPRRPVAGGAKRRIDHRGDGALAVRAGDVDGPKRSLRMAEAVENRADVVETELDPEVFEAEEIFECGVHKSANTEVTELYGEPRKSI
jgi:hypothetical protein